MTHPKHSSRTPPRGGPPKSRAGRDTADENLRLDEDDDDETFGADVANADRELDPGGVHLDTEETDDTSAAAERIATAGGEIDEEMREELRVDNVVGPFEAGLGEGLDQQEEAELGITDEEIAEKAEAIARKARRQ